MVVGANIQRTLKIIEDKQLGTYELRFYRLLSVTVFYLSEGGSSVAFRSRKFQELQRST